MSDFQKFGSVSFYLQIQDPIVFEGMWWKLANNLTLKDKEKQYLEKNPDIPAFDYFDCNVILRIGVTDKVVYKCNKLHLALVFKYVHDLMTYENEISVINLNLGLPEGEKALEMVLNYVHDHSVAEEVYRMRDMVVLHDIYVVASFLQLRNFEHSGLGIALESAADAQKYAIDNQGPEDQVATFYSYSRRAHSWPKLYFLLDYLVYRIGLDYNKARSAIVKLPRDTFVDLISNPYFIPREFSFVSTSTRELTVLQAMILHYEETNEPFSIDEYKKMTLYENPYRKLFHSIIEKQVPKLIEGGLAPSSIINCEQHRQRHIEYGKFSQEFVSNSNWKMPYDSTNDQIYPAVLGQDDVWGIEIVFDKFQIDDESVTVNPPSFVRNGSCTSLREVRMCFRNAEESDIDAKTGYLIPAESYHKTILKGFPRAIREREGTKYIVTSTGAEKRVKNHEIYTEKVKCKDFNDIKKNYNYLIKFFAFTGDLDYPEVCGTAFRIDRTYWCIGPAYNRESLESHVNSDKVHVEHMYNFRFSENGNLLTDWFIYEVRKQNK